MFHFNSSDYLLIADYYSKYLFIKKVPKGNFSSLKIVKLTKQIFGEQATPKFVRSDHGPQYDGQAYKQFSREYGFQHVTSSPHYPRSNGFIESQVKIVKRTLEKAKKTGEDTEMALLCLRATPIDNELPSPAELLFGREIQDNMLRILDSCVSGERIVQRLRTKQYNQKRYYDQNTRILPNLTAGQKIFIQNHNTQNWAPATIERKLEAPRSYDVETPVAITLRRNRIHIRPRLEGDQEREDDVEETTREDPPTLTEITTLSFPFVTRSGRISRMPKRLDL